VTGSRFRTARAVCCLSVPEAAQLLRVSERTIQYWESGRVRVPYSAYKLMRILRGYELPGHAWRGYTLRGDTLWSPEGLPFKAADHRWWSLTCRMAAEFRSMAAARRLAGPGSYGLVLSSTSRPRDQETAEISGFPARLSPDLEGQGQGPVLQQDARAPLGVAA
jgi:transcriptional regulator with XRE-family HTH domain